MGLRPKRESNIITSNRTGDCSSTCIETEGEKRGETSSELPVEPRLGRQGRVRKVAEGRKGGRRSLKGRELHGATPGAWMGGVDQLKLPGCDRREE